MDDRKGDVQQVDRDTWTDSEEAGAGPVVDTHELFQLRTAAEEKRELRAAELERQRHFMRMQVRVMLGVGLVFLVTLVTLVLGLWLHLMPQGVAEELMRMVIPTVLGAGLTITGMFFRGGGGSRP
ncbi:hypothetical protein V5P93_002404 [Actinokineospora auranticolor]|uniref:Uncharacterized protein n=1 Tax=Actinokineospora auranticolor TaxID=155976 RepID=A0A2S6GC04_9PSEU|nr:hypothetical protein [Actinokineospora auranticolor]PPK61860.1 hypothetical protein CLV40_1388 [Actinokineospora auranticolor]